MDWLYEQVREVFANLISSEARAGRWDNVEHLARAADLVLFWKHGWPTDTPLAILSDGRILPLSEITNRELPAITNILTSERDLDAYKLASAAHAIQKYKPKPTRNNFSTTLKKTLQLTHNKKTKRNKQ